MRLMEDETEAKELARIIEDYLDTLTVEYRVIFSVYFNGAVAPVIIQESLALQLRFLFCDGKLYKTMLSQVMPLYR